jgi:predicted MPP superfamily phosphohydrolase
MIIIKVILIMGLIIAIIHILHALILDRIIEYKEVSFSSTKISPELNGYRIAFITDAHAISERRLKGVVKELNNKDIDLLLLGGDFRSRKGAEMRNIKILSEVKTTDGIFGVEGNHDNSRNLFRAMEEHSAKKLSNEGLHIKENFYLAGVEDFWRRNSDIAKAIEGALPDDFVILMAHNPDVSMEQDTTGVQLILSGHTHGGQINFFGIWAPYFTFSDRITIHGQRFRSGWAESRDGATVFISNGVGGYVPRVFARPQVVIITLQSE